jgi:hypothetical protein
MFRRAFIAVIGLLTVSVAAQAQAPGFVPRPGPVFTPPPAFSPYLNLIRNGNSPGVNYYGLVRPQLEFRSAMQNLQGQVNMNQQMIGQMQNQSLQMSDTGHSTMFMNLNGYFMNSGGTGAQRGNPGMNTFRGPQQTGNAGSLNRGGGMPAQGSQGSPAPQGPRR